MRQLLACALERRRIADARPLQLLVAHLVIRGAGDSRPGQLDRRVGRRRVARDQRREQVAWSRTGIPLDCRRGRRPGCVVDYDLDLVAQVRRLRTVVEPESLTGRRRGVGEQGTRVGVRRHTAADREPQQREPARAALDHRRRRRHLQPVRARRGHRQRQRRRLRRRRGVRIRQRHRDRARSRRRRTIDGMRALGLAVRVQARRRAPVDT